MKDIWNDKFSHQQFFTAIGLKSSKLQKAWYTIIMYTSSAVLATASKPMYAKKAVAEPAIIPSIPNGKYLLIKLKEETNIIR